MLILRLSSGAVGFARGLNDGPKLVAIGAAVAGAYVSLDALRDLLLAWTLTPLVAGPLPAASYAAALRLA